MLRILIPAISGVFAVIDWVAVDRRERRVEYVAKPGTLLFLLLTALVLSPDSGSQRAWFVAALAFSLAGDVFLMLPRDRFVYGLASFLAAHVAYMVGFSLEPGGLSLARWLGAAQILAVVAAIVAPPILRAAPDRLRAPVAAYMAVISVMVATAASSSDWIALLGAALFYWSDATIAWNRFVRPFPLAKVVIIVTYHLAQFALVGSLLV